MNIEIEKRIIQLQLLSDTSKIIDILNNNVIDIHFDNDMLLLYAYFISDISFMQYLFNYGERTNNKYKQYTITPFVLESIYCGKESFVKCFHNYCWKHNYILSTDKTIVIYTEITHYDILQYETCLYVLYLYKHSCLLDNINYIIYTTDKPNGLLNMKKINITHYIYIYNNMIIQPCTLHTNIKEANYILSCIGNNSD